MTDSAPMPLACSISAIAPDQRAQHAQVTAELLERMRAVNELENGYAFQFANQSPTILKLAEFVSNERMCCPFLKFDLAIGPYDAPLSLRLTGPDNVKQFLQAEFAAAFQREYR